MRTIAVVTGTRAEYGYLKPLMHAIQQEKDLKLLPIITGMHLLSQFGNTYKIVKKDFPSAKKIRMTLKGDQLKHMAEYLASGINNFATFLDKNHPDILVVLGDRSESLAAALAAAYLNIPIAHINGGDVSGTTIDESIRHAITKIAHIHLVHTKENAERVEKMGEEKKRIFVTGALTLDTIMHTKLASKEETFKKHHLNPNKTAFLVVQHPITTLKDRGYSQLKELFLALDSLKEQTVLLYPNCDAGGKKFIDLITTYEKKPYLHAFKNIPHEEYLSIMKSVDLMLGNSSSGIIEAPSFKIPVINIGSRQQGRGRSANILDIPPEKNSIINAIDFALHNKEFQRKVDTCKNQFGDGNAAQHMIKIFKEIPLDEGLIQKQITY
ncbi:MAG: UDP-N-acetylglucosamine 2-epimerase (hydrolyzing) [Thermoplasmata archaeon]|nr:UDP-N-acetylglucosamine 2-epimerase (hydrolyzing) [Thermoplasmata archaeon]MBE3140854.1 UDP-N-acetylglucosamine 2-epimerase (hydrolyzing) [Thermoplasmata archaeon]